MSGRGTLYIVATPIGNLKDITLRALEVLGRVDVVACEDTRHTRKLLDRHGIEVRTVSYHKFNERKRAAEILEILAEGRSVALVTDAGTPGISDPGNEVVARAAEAGFTVVPIPGAAAPSVLLSAAGLPGRGHTFVGFAPHRAGERRRFLARLAEREEVVVLFEAPTRIAATLRDLVELLGGERPAVLGRELTKMHEEIVRGTLASLADQVGAAEPRGEFTVAIGGKTGPPRTLPEGTVAEQVRFAREEMGLERMEAMRYVARERGVSKGKIYAEVVGEE